MQDEVSLKFNEAFVGLHLIADTNKHFRLRTCTEGESVRIWALSHLRKSQENGHKIFIARLTAFPKLSKERDACDMYTPHKAAASVECEPRVAVFILSDQVPRCQIEIGTEL